MPNFLNRKKKTQETDDDASKLLVSKIQKMYRDSYNNKAPYHELWDKCFKAYSSEYFKKKLPDYKIQEISNFVFGTVETVKPILLANNPKFLVMPKREQDYSKSKKVQYALDHEWTRTKMFTKLLQCITYGLIYGTVPIFLPWNGELSRGLGDVDPTILSPFNIIVDPMATSVDDAEYMGYATYKNVGEVIKAFPEKADELNKSTGAVQDEYLTYGKDSSNVNSSTNILYIEMYFRDYSTEVTEETGENGEKYRVTKMKYPRGRRVIIAGDVLLTDGENPYQDGRFPFVLWKCYDIPGRFWGIGEVEMILSPQEAICEINNSIIENAGLMGNPVWVLDKNSGVEKGSLTNRKGLVVRKNPGTEVRRESPPPLPAYIQNIITDLKSDIERISGVFDVTRGEKPAGVTAAAAIQALNEQAQGRIKLKAQAIEQMLGELGSMWVSRIQQFWVTTRSIRIMGAEYIANSDNQMQPQPMELGGQSFSFTDIDGTDLDGDFDIFVVGGSTMAINKSAKLQLLIQLGQTMAEDGLPMVDRQTILENADIDNVEEVLQRFDAIKQQQAQMQQEQTMAQQQAQEQQMAMEQQAQQQQMALEQQKTEQQMMMDAKSKEHDMMMKEREHQMNIEQGQADTENQMSLQRNEMNLQSESEEQKIQQLISELSKMSPEQLSDFFEENPDIRELLAQVLGEQSDGNSQGGM